MPHFSHGLCIYIHMLETVWVKENVNFNDKIEITCSNSKLTWKFLDFFDAGKYIFNFIIEMSVFHAILLVNIVNRYDKFCSPKKRSKFDMI